MLLNKILHMFDKKPIGVIVEKEVVVEDETIREKGTENKDRAVKCKTVIENTYFGVTESVIQEYIDKYDQFKSAPIDTVRLIVGELEHRKKCRTKSSYCNDLFCRDCPLWEYGIAVQNARYGWVKK